MLRMQSGVKKFKPQVRAGEKKKCAGKQVRGRKKDTEERDDKALYCRYVMLHTKLPQTWWFKTTTFILLTTMQFGEGLVGKVCLCSLKDQQGWLPEGWRTVFPEGSLMHLARRC